LALRLDTLGFKVYAGCLHADGSGAEDLKSKASERLHVIQLDVTNQEQIDAAFQIIKSTLDVCSK
jgi:3-hydroxybutyrate dehydrogenase